MKNDPKQGSAGGITGGSNGGSTSGGSTSNTGVTGKSEPVKTDANGVPEKGCTSDDTGANVVCNWKQMATPTCPVPGNNVAMPDNCRP